MMTGRHPTVGHLGAQRSTMPMHQASLAFPDSGKGRRRRFPRGPTRQRPRQPDALRWRGLTHAVATEGFPSQAQSCFLTWAVTDAISRAALAARIVLDAVICSRMQGGN